ncbi:alpha/beta hydrolase [Clostridium sp. DL1XJH146]
MKNNVIKDKFSVIKSKVKNSLDKSNSIYEKYGKGSFVFLCAFLIIIAALCGTTITTGLGVPLDMVILCLIVLGVFLGAYYLLNFIIWIIKIIDGKIIAASLASIFLVYYLLDEYTRFADYLNWILAISIIIVQVVLGMTIYLLYKKKELKLIPVIILTMTLSIDIFGFYWILRPGKKDDVVSNYINSETYMDFYSSSVNNSNYSELVDEGDYTVDKVFYGSGDDRRDYYGENVDIITTTVSADPFLEDYKGRQSKIRELFWGFSQKEMPLNAVVWYPEEEGNYPITFILHGNHSMEDYSELGYEYLGEFLASKGYIVVSVDENFLNGSWSGGMSKENDARAWMLLKHLELWSDFSEDENSIFFEKVDMDNIALIGHSRGGEAVVLASYFNDPSGYKYNDDIQFNFNFNIKSIATIAPSDGQYKPNNKYVVPRNVDFLALSGASDADVSNFVGSNIYDRLEFKDAEYHFKTYLYILGANHGQFNSSWGSFDSSTPAKALINRANLIEEKDQEEIAKIYLNAFLDCTLKDEDKYLDLFKDYRIAQDILPQTLYYSKFEDTTYRVISDFEEDYNKTTASINEGKIKNINFTKCEEKSLSFKDGDKRSNHAVFLEWDSDKAKYSIDFSESNIDFYRIEEEDNLTFSACDLDDSKLNLNIEEVKQTDFTISLFDKEGNAGEVEFSDYYLMTPPIRLNVTKLEFYDEIKYGTDIDQILQTYTIPLKDFKENNNSLSLDNLAKIEFNFKGNGKIVLDDVGILK